MNRKRAGAPTALLFASMALLGACETMDETNMAAEAPTTAEVHAHTDKLLTEFAARESALMPRRVSETAVVLSVDYDSRARVLTTVVEQTIDDREVAMDAFARAYLARVPDDCIEHAAMVIGGGATMRTDLVDQEGRKFLQYDLSPAICGY